MIHNNAYTCDAYSPHIRERGRAFKPDIIPSEDTFAHTAISRGPKLVVLAFMRWGSANFIMAAYKRQRSCMPLTIKCPRGCLYGLAADIIPSKGLVQTIRVVLGINKDAGECTKCG
jgi:hypothetical protein